MRLRNVVPSLVGIGLLFSFLSHAQMPSFSERDPRYRLQPSDVIEVHYRYSPEFDQTATIQPDGFLALVLIGDIKVQGMTVAQAKDVILAKSVQRLKDPEITLVLKEFEKPYFVVGGEVNTPGKFEMRGPVNPLQAIAMAGGFKALDAKHSQVILLRRVGPDLAKTEILNLKDMMTPNKKSEPLADLHSGDMLLVPQNQISKIERIVKLSNLGAYIPIPF
jgi:polysaccharide export outer membrane protein